MQKKASNSEDFKHWFVEKDYGEVNLRQKKKYEEMYARTNSLKNSPLLYMRRALNEEIQEEI